MPSLNQNLQDLDCSNDNLTSLPSLNENLQLLDCHDNKLTSLPSLNKNLQQLYCSKNKLTSLPQLNENLEELYCYDNDIPEMLINFRIISENKRNLINNVAKCRYKIMCLKYKEHFRRWLWIKVRLPKIQKHYHPDNLEKILDALGEDCDENELDEVIENW